jgi:predicted nucleotidyltransferase
MPNEANLQERDRIIRNIKKIERQLVTLNLRKLLIFGSIAKATQNKDSDLDVLIYPRITGHKGRICKVLQTATHRPIEVVYMAELRDPFRDEILRTAITVIDLNAYCGENSQSKQKQETNIGKNVKDSY